MQRIFLYAFNPVMTLLAAIYVFPNIGFADIDNQNMRVIVGYIVSFLIGIISPIIMVMKYHITLIQAVASTFWAGLLVGTILGGYAYFPRNF